jgi:hypothetical protein
MKLYRRIQQEILSLLMGAHENRDGNAEIAYHVAIIAPEIRLLLPAFCKTRRNIHEA